MLSMVLGICFLCLIVYVYSWLFSLVLKPMHRRKIPYIIREGIISNPEYYRLNCLKSKQPMQKKH